MPPAATPTRSSLFFDFVAMGLSGLCLAHCLLLPFAIVALPTLGFLSDEHWVHQVLIAMAIPVSLWATLRSGHWRKALVGLPMLTGLGLLGGAAFYAPFEAYEMPLSVCGALLLAFAHYRNTRLSHARGHRH